MEPGPSSSDAIAEILDGLGDAFYALDAEWRIVAANDRACALWGVRRDDAVGRLAAELFPAWPGSASHRAHLRAAAEGRPMRLETFSTSFRRPIELDILPQDAGLAVRVRDLSEAARLQGERQAILDTMAQGVAVFDSAGGLRYRNAAARAILGIASDEEIPGYVGAEHPLDPRWMDGTPIPRSEHPVSHALRGRPARGVDIRIRRVSDGREIVCRYDAEALRASGDEEVSGVVLTFQDITREIEAAEALRLREETLRLAQEAAQIGSFSWDVASGLVTVSQTFAELYGRPEADPQGPRIAWIDQVHPEDRRLFDRLRAEAFARGEEVFRGQFRILRPDGAQRWVESRSRTYYDDDGRPLRVVGVQADITGRKRAEAALQASEGRLRLALEFAGLGDWSWDAASDLVTLSERGAALFGAPPGPSMSWAAMRELLHPEDRERARLAVERAVAERGEYDIEYRVQQPQGAQLWIAARGRAQYDESGAPLGMIGVVQDVTARRESEERQKLLMAELDHRVKNVLAVVQAIAQQTLPGGAGDADFAGRLAALARAHGLLARQNWQGASLRALLSDTLSPHGGVGGRIGLDGPDLLLNPRAAQTLALAFHEMATNAAKYGGLSNREGRLSIAWAVEAPAAVLALEWRETGGPSVGRPQRRGFGARLVQQSIAHELGGRVRTAFPPEGLIASFELPIAEIVGPKRRVGSGRA